MKWISVKDKLPDDEKEVLIWAKFRDFKEYILTEAQFMILPNKIKPIWVMWHDIDEHWKFALEDVSHWMRLPEAPKDRISNEN